MERIIIDIVISSDEYLKHYRMPGATVSSRSRDGRRVHFPAKILQPFVTHSGIAGSFEISFDQSGKFSAIKRLA